MPFPDTNSVNNAKYLIWPILDVCVTVRHQYCNNLFRLLFKSALHVSGDKFVHHQEHFLTVYAAFGKTDRHCCRPVPRLRRN